MTDIPFSNMMLNNEVEKEVRSQKLKSAEKILSILEKIKEFEKTPTSLVPIQNIVIDVKPLPDDDKKNIVKAVIIQSHFSGTLRLAYSCSQLDELIKDEEAIQILQKFSKAYHERLEHRSQVLKLWGRTQLLSEQIKAKQRQEVSDRLASKGSGQLKF